MQISEFTFKLIILLIPGALASKMYQKLVVHEKWTPFQFVANSILLGGASYLISGLVSVLRLSFIGSPNADSFGAFWQNLPTKEIPFNDVIWACVSSVFLALAISAFDHYKLLNKFGKFIQVSNKYGDENLYYNFLNAEEVNEVYIRDKDAGFTYHGLVDSFSDNSATHEIVLRQVVVYEYETSQELYELDKIYLSKTKDGFKIELPFQQLNSAQNAGTQTTVQAP